MKEVGLWILKLRQFEVAIQGRIFLKHQYFDRHNYSVVAKSKQTILPPKKNNNKQAHKQTHNNPKSQWAKLNKVYFSLRPSPLQVWHLWRGTFSQFNNFFPPFLPSMLHTIIILGTHEEVNLPSLIRVSLSHHNWRATILYFLRQPSRLRNIPSSYTYSNKNKCSTLPTLSRKEQLERYWPALLHFYPEISHLMWPQPLARSILMTSSSCIIVENLNRRKNRYWWILVMCPKQITEIGKK